MGNTPSEMIIHHPVISPQEAGQMHAPALPLASDEGWSFVDAVPEAIASISAKMLSQAQVRHSSAVGPRDGHPTTPNTGDGAGTAQAVPGLHLDAQRSSELRDAVQEFSRYYRELAPLRQKILLVRGEASYDAKSVQDHRRYVLESKQALTENVSPSNKDRYSQASTNAMNDFLRDMDAFDQQAEKVHTTISHLGSLEFTLQETEEHLDQSAQSILAKLRRFGIVDPPEQLAPEKSGIGPQSSQSSARESARVHPLIAEYYDKVGDLKIMRERLMVFNTEYGDTQASRTFDVDHERILDTSDDEFEAAYKRERAEMEKAVETAKNAAKTAKAACTAQGLDSDVGENQASDQQGSACDTPGVSEPALLLPMPLTPILGDPSEFCVRATPPGHATLVVTNVMEANARNAPSSLWTPAATGPMISGVSTPRETKRDRANKALYVEDWIDKVDSEKDDWPIDQRVQSQVPELPDNSPLGTFHSLPPSDKKGRGQALDGTITSLPGTLQAQGISIPDGQGFSPMTLQNPRSFAESRSANSGQRRCSH